MKREIATALELTREGWKSFLEGAHRRLIVPELTDAQRRDRDLLLQRVREAAEVLRTRFGARRVLLFGSLSQPYWFREDSDVDLAAEGLKSGKDYWDAWEAIEEIIPDRLGGPYRNRNGRRMLERGDSTVRP